MAYFFHQLSSRSFRNRSAFLLALYFFIGFLTGAFSVSFSGTSFTAQALSGHTSIFLRFLILSMPVTLSVLAVCLSAPESVYLICFFSAFLFSYNSFLFVFSHSNSGWLLRALLMFPEYSSMPLIYFFWSLQLSDDSHLCRIAGFFVVLFILFACILEHYTISPFVRSLFL